MEIKGYATHFDSRHPEDTKIELPPVNLAKIKEGDEVWVKSKIKSYDKNSKGFVTVTWNDVIAHFPAQKEQPKQEIKIIKNPISMTDDAVWIHWITECIDKVCIDKINEISKMKEGR